MSGKPFRSRREKLKGRREYGSFLLLPHAVMHSSNFKSQSGNALRLLMHIAGQYNGKNNGSLTASFSVLHAEGWGSRTTLSRCVKELEELGLVIKTRQGNYPNTLSLYAITWVNLDECIKGEYDAALSAFVGKRLGHWKK